MGLYRDAQNEPPAAYCERCQGEIYQRESMYLWNGKWVCMDCLRGVVERMLRQDLDLLADELGLERSQPK